jgi:hypothetical protein
LSYGDIAARLEEAGYKTPDIAITVVGTAYISEIGRLTGA